MAVRSVKCFGRLIGAPGRWVLLSDEGAKYRLDIDPAAQGIEPHERYPWIVELSEAQARGKLDEPMLARIRREAGDRRRTCAKCGEDQSLLAFRRHDHSVCDRCRFLKDVRRYVDREELADITARMFPTFNSVSTVSGGLPTLGKRR